MRSLAPRTVKPFAHPRRRRRGRGRNGLPLDWRVWTPRSFARSPARRSSLRPVPRGLRCARAAWFGRRDLIPPDHDTRTLLIDRAMVTQGLLMPAELAHIHKIARKWTASGRTSRTRARWPMPPSFARKSMREALKQQKKQEAAERKRLHAEGATRRKQTDIVFLGRGVSRGLADRRANVEKLQQLGLPLLATPTDLATAMEISIPRLRWLAFHNEVASRTHYVRFTVPKKSGGTRELAVPHRDLRRCQEWILHNILDKLPVHDAAHGFARGRSTLTNAAGHAGHEVLVNTDLKDFFPSITFPRVLGMFGGMGYSPAAATILALLCTECPRRTVEYAGTTYHVATGPRGLPQGACTSPALSNRARGSSMPDWPAWPRSLAGRIRAMPTTPPSRPRAKRPIPWVTCWRGSGTSARMKDS